MNYWEKMNSSLMGTAQTQTIKPGKMTKAVLTQLLKVDDETKRYIFGKYVARCRELHAIAFLQWRKKFPSKVAATTEEDIDDLLTSRIYHLTSDENMKLGQSPLPATTKNAQINKEFYVRFKDFLKVAEY